MRKISAQYVFTSAGRPLRRAVITAGDDNTIVAVEDTGGHLAERAATEFYNGVIIPGLVNCHTHLELSHMHGTLPAGRGLADFVTSVREKRETDAEGVISAAIKADAEMFAEGIVLCGDISNNSLTFSIKNSSPVSYTTFIEVFGINPVRAD
jgi:cytosine/adenosine deaminase-related metal-dependent hydrolase